MEFQSNHRPQCLRDVDSTLVAVGCRLSSPRGTAHFLSCPACNSGFRLGVVAVGFVAVRNREFGHCSLGRPQVAPGAFSELRVFAACS